MNMFGSTPKPASPTFGSNASNGSYSSNYGSAPEKSGAAILSSGVSIKGTVKFTSELIIDGEVEGNITSNGTLTCGSHATVIGDIRAGSVTIRGSVDANVLATERCALEAGATLNG